MQMHVENSTNSGFSRDFKTLLHMGNVRRCVDVLEKDVLNKVL